MLIAGRTEDHLVEITLTTVAAYGSFLVAERMDDPRVGVAPLAAEGDVAVDLIEVGAPLDQLADPDRRLAENRTLSRGR